MIKDHEKVAAKKQEEARESEEHGIVVGKAYDFLFEGEDEKYDEKYADYI